MKVNGLRKICAVAATANLILLSLGAADASDSIVDKLRGGSGRQYRSGDNRGDPRVGPRADNRVKEHSWSEHFKDISSTRLSTVLQRRRKQSSTSGVRGTRARSKLRKTDTASKFLVAATVLAVALWRLARVFWMCLHRYTGQRHAGATPRSLSDVDEDSNACSPFDGNHSDDGAEESEVAIPLMELSPEGSGDGVEEPEGAATRRRGWKLSDKLAVIFTAVFSVVFTAAYMGIVLYFQFNKQTDYGPGGEGRKKNPTSLLLTEGNSTTAGGLLSPSFSGRNTSSLEQVAVPSPAQGETSGQAAHFTPSPAGGNNETDADGPGASVPAAPPGTRVEITTPSHLSGADNGIDKQPEPEPSSATSTNHGTTPTLTEITVAGGNDSDPLTAPETFVTSGDVADSPPSKEPSLASGKRTGTTAPAAIPTPQQRNGTATAPPGEILMSRNYTTIPTSAATSASQQRNSADTP
ncbi:hypothetical protein CSUI_007963 [Cystoisospora suis]|uniref:Transmembrane protein n=1 Tax=Cystoisospora suis TaxID=483139 RepID=A0A2C6KP07_9APIC|nr:hypothetical protein CSUI_007963 [Cystoisospora suis]